MIFERENCKPIVSPSSQRIASELRRVGRGRSGFAHLTSEDGSYLQVAGFQVACRLERRDRSLRRHYCAFQDPPVTAYPDGAELVCTAGKILMKPDEWFMMDQVIEAFQAFLEGRPFPDYIRWRDSTEELAARGIERP